MTARTTVTCDGCGETDLTLTQCTCISAYDRSQLHACVECSNRAFDALSLGKTSAATDVAALKRDGERLLAELEEIRERSARERASYLEALTDRSEAETRLEMKAALLDEALARHEAAERAVAGLRDLLGEREREHAAARARHERTVAAMSLATDDLVRMLGKKRRRRFADHPAVAARAIRVTQ